ncbi:CoA ester lyase [Oceanicola sp. 502str15]|uniref:HpcH/HpaI aldolase/citrate lyase family protein n=1 Tax=Oceanicola sp. 502str15 TaxID=2696061 RepID=UPI00209496BD|nr:CoA ester lyase [Oceanicola sp. 502str15]MCO6383245.1 CoA ester lyase [Oceanicola sp. 502str15]
MPATRPYRSLLYIPGSKPRALEKAATLACDAIIFDLEDAVTAEAKDEARALLAETLPTADYGPRARIVRVNGADTQWGAADLEAMCKLAPDAILLPKVGHADEIAEVKARLDAAGSTSTKVWAMMETPQGIFNAESICAAPGMGGIVMGTNDLAKELNCRNRADRLPMMFALQQCLMAARAAGIVAIDGVYNAFKDDEGLKAECEQGRDLGFDGKTLIHPAQLEITNAAFAPSESEIDLARRQIAAYQEVEASGQGVAVVDGRIVENLHIETARATLARAEAIAAMAG